MNQNKKLKLISLEAEDVLRLRAVRIQADGKNVRITGPNDQGKTTVLKLLEMAIGGKSAVPEKPIRDGADKGYIIADLGDLVVKRVFTAKDSYLTVHSKEQGSPQQILNRMMGKDGKRAALGIDPLEFAEMDPKKQAEVLLKVSDVRLNMEDWRRDLDMLVEARKDAGKLLKLAEAADQDLDDFPNDTPDEGVSISEMVVKADEFRAEQIRNEEARSHLALMETLVDQDRFEKIDLEEKLRGVEGTIEARMKEVKVQRDEVAALRDVTMDLAKVGEEMVGADEVNKNVRAKAAAATSKKRMAEARVLHAAAEASVKEHRKERTNALAEATMPIEGLSVGENGLVEFEGHPFKQLGTSKRFRVCLAMVMALNPKLRVILIDGIEMLDEENLAFVEKVTTEEGYQVISTMVSSKPGKTGVHIVDGEVVAVDGKPQLKEVTP